MLYLIFCYNTIEFLLCCYVFVDFVPKVWKRISAHAKENLRKVNYNYSNNNRNLIEVVNENIIPSAPSGLSKIEGKVTMIARQWEDHKMFTSSKQNVINITNSFENEFENNLNEFERNQISSIKEKNLFNSSKRNSITFLNEEDDFEANKENNNEEFCNVQRRRSTVSEIAKIFEMNDNKSRIHVNSKTHHIPENYFEGHKNVNNIIIGEDFNEKHVTLNGYIDKLKSETEIAISKANNLERNSFSQTAVADDNDGKKCQHNQQQDKINCSLSMSTLSLYDDPKLLDTVNNEIRVYEMNEPLISIQTTTSNGEKEYSTRENSSWSSENENEEDSTPTNESPSPPSQSPLPLSTTEVKLRNHEKVQTVEEILSQQRFSRRLSAYSISEFLKDIPNEVDIDKIINDIGK